MQVPTIPILCQPVLISISDYNYLLDCLKLRVSIGLLYQTYYFASIINLKIIFSTADFGHYGFYHLKLFF